VQAQGDNLREEHMHRIVMTNEVVNDTAREKKAELMIRKRRITVCMSVRESGIPEKVEEKRRKDL